LLGLAAAPATPPQVGPALSEAPLPVAGHHGAGGPRNSRPTVIDLSSLWAGPLCGQLLHLCDAEVIKVESMHRPDGARFGNATFYGLLNQGKHSVALDLHHPEDRRKLKDLLLSADIVIEASRPRALQQLGIDVESLLKERPQLTWLSITGYGREEPQAQWIAFGDDAGVAAGLSEVMRQATGRHQFVGDAIADPLTGIRAALAAWRSWLSGGGQLIQLALADVAAESLAEALNASSDSCVQQAFADWWNDVLRNGASGANMRQRAIVDRVARLGEDTEPVLRRRGIRC
jgi:crotonobetainyl-CoA:carnitine CoA-transferase CaiB-like acyl-CoA transferase